MKRQEIQSYLTALNGVADIKGVKFAFTVLKNKKKIEKQIEEDKEIIQTVLAASDKFKEFESKRLDLCKVHSHKDENGEAIIKDDKFDLINTDLFNADFNILKDEYNESILEREKQIREFEELMNEEVPVDFTKVKFDDLPQDLTERQLETIAFMIDLED